MRWLWIVLLAAPALAADRRPNIVWIVVEDMSTPFGCYGETQIATPHVDRLASRGVKFTRAFVTAPVCSAARSALVTGMVQTTIGASGRRRGSGTSTSSLPALARGCRSGSQVVQRHLHLLERCPVQL